MRNKGRAGWQDNNSHITYVPENDPEDLFDNNLGPTDRVMTALGVFAVCAVWLMVLGWWFWLRR